MMRNTLWILGVQMLKAVSIDIGFPRVDAVLFVTLNITGQSPVA
ncbi:MAG: hypothetical protein K0Q64_1188 [Nitrobacter vulgaris]|jgi:hypothetical protein|nr:hypothetical protein [Nitrobacter vulgaris]